MKKLSLFLTHPEAGNTWSRETIDDFNRWSESATVTPTNTVWDEIYSTFGLKPYQGAGQLRYLGETGEMTNQALLCLDLANIHIGINQMRLFPATIEQDAQLKIFEELESFFSEDNWHFLSTTRHMYLMLEGLPEISTTPFVQAVYQDTSNQLPAGQHVKYWHQKLNEAQMLIHNLGIDGVNTLWMWGEGLPVIERKEKIHTCSDDCLIKGMAMLTEQKLCTAEAPEENDHVVLVETNVNNEHRVQAVLQQWQSKDIQELNIYFAGKKITRKLKKRWFF